MDNGTEGFWWTRDEAVQGREDGEAPEQRAGYLHRWDASRPTRRTPSSQTSSSPWYDYTCNYDAGGRGSDPTNDLREELEEVVEVLTMVSDKHQNKDKSNIFIAGMFDVWDGLKDASLIGVWVSKDSDVINNKLSSLFYSISFLFSKLQAVNKLKEMGITLHLVLCSSVSVSEAKWFN